MTALTKLEPESFAPQSSPSFATSTWGSGTVPTSLAALPQLHSTASGSTAALSSTQPSYYGEHHTPARPPLLQRSSGGLADIDPRSAPRSVHHPSSAALMSSSGWYTSAGSASGGASLSSLNSAAAPLSSRTGRSTLASGPTSGDVPSSHHSYGNHSHSNAGHAGPQSGAHSLLSQSPLTSASAPPQPAHPLPSWLSPVQSSHNVGLSSSSPTTGNHHGSSGSSTTHSPYNAGSVPSHSSLYTSTSAHSQSALPLFTSAWNSHQQHHGSAASSNAASHYQSSGVAVPAGSVTSPGEYYHTQSAYSAPSYTSPLPGGPTPGSQYSGEAPSSYAGSHYGGASTPGAAASGGASHYTTSAQQQGSGLGLNPLGINVESGYGGGRYRSDTTYESSNPVSRASDYGSSYASRMHSSSTAGGLSRSSSSYLSSSLTSPPVRPQMGMRTTSDPSMSSPVTFGSYTTMHDYSTDEARWNALLNRSHSADRAFVYGAMTTRIFCRPSCASKRPDRNRVRFFTFPNAAQQAEAAGFRACKRCKPGTQGTADQCVLAVGDCVRHITNSAVAGESGDGDLKRKTLKEYAARAGLSAFHFHRTFKAVSSLTPGEYAKACHALALQDAIGRDATRTGDVVTSQALTRALLGWSTRRARRAVGGILPSSYAAGCLELNMLLVTARDTPYGNVSVLYTEASHGDHASDDSSTPDDEAGTLFAVALGQESERRLQVRCPTAVRIADREPWLYDIVMRLVRAGDREVQLPDEVVPSVRRARIWNAVRKDLERKEGEEADELEAPKQQQQQQQQSAMSAPMQHGHPQMQAQYASHAHHQVAPPQHHQAQQHQAQQMHGMPSHQHQQQSQQQHMPPQQQQQQSQHHHHLSLGGHFPAPQPQAHHPVMSQQQQSHQLSQQQQQLLRRL